MTSVPATSDLQGPPKGMLVIWLHAAVALFQLPLLLIYFRSLWLQPHYEWFPWLLVLALVLFFMRIQRSRIDEQLRSNWFANLCLIVAVGALIAGNVLFEPQAAAIGCFFLAGSLLARFRDLETGGTLLPIWVLLALVIRPPFNLDIRLITFLQNVTSKFASSCLDWVGVKHYLEGNVLSVSNKQFFVEEACSGVISLFLLLFLTLGYLVLTRRTVIRSVILLITAVFWAGFMNTVRVFTVVFAHDKMDWNLADGWRHATLGYMTLLFAILMVISTDSFLTFLFGPVHVEFGHKTRFKRMMSWLGGLLFPKASSRDPKKPGITKAGMIFVGCLCVVALLSGLYPIVQLGPVGVANQVGKSLKLFEIAESALPQEFNIDLDVGARNLTTTWKAANFETEERERNSDWGTRSSSWVLTTQNAFTFVSCDYPFVGWHDLSTCYRGNGWTIVTRNVAKPIDGSDWDYVVLELSKPNGEYQYVFFSLFDEYGNGAQPTSRAVMNLNYVSRIASAFRRRMDRDYGPYPQTYQVQNVVQTTGPLPAMEWRFIAKTHEQIREELRRHVIGDLHEREVPSLNGVEETE